MTNPPDTATDFERELDECAQSYRKRALFNIRTPIELGFYEGARWALTSTVCRQMAACLASINVQQIVNGKAGQELRATEISEILEAYRQACEGKT